jgi:hypothetical protein
MKKEIEIVMPEGRHDVSLKTYLSLQKDLESYIDDEQAQIALMLYHLCGIDANMLQTLSQASFNRLKLELNTFMQPTEIPLKRIIDIDGIEYGFEPNLSQIAYGAYADISKYDTVQIDDNWAKIMSILYRPVIDKGNADTYTIKPYDGKIDGSKFLNVPMDIHFSTLFFFVRLSDHLLNYTLNSTIPMEMSPHFKSILVESGKLIQPLWSLQMATYER